MKNQSFARARNKRKPRVVFFSGQNGAGKSTQMSLLVGALKNRGIKVRTTWIASHNLLVWFLAVIFAKLGYPKDHWSTLNPKSTPIADLRFFKNTRKPSVLLLLVLEVANVVTADLFKVRIPKLFGYWVIVEKYIPTTIADMIPLCGFQFSSSVIIRFLLSLIPKNACGVFLHASYETLLARRGTKTEPKKYLEAQRLVDGWYADHYFSLVIDTSEMSIKKTHELILKHLNLS
jgi:hypothetical protein